MTLCTVRFANNQLARIVKTMLYCSKPNRTSHSSLGLQIASGSGPGGQAPLCWTRAEAARVRCTWHAAHYAHYWDPETLREVPVAKGAASPQRAPTPPTPRLWQSGPPSPDSSAAPSEVGACSANPRLCGLRLSSTLHAGPAQPTSPQAGGLCAQAPGTRLI